MREVNRMPHARVQAGCHQFLFLLPRAKLSLSGELVSAKLREDATIDAESREEERDRRQPSPGGLINLLRMPRPGEFRQNGYDQCPDWKQGAIGRSFHPPPAPCEWMDREPKKRDAAVDHSYHPGDEQQQLCLHDLIVTVQFNVEEFYPAKHLVNPL